MMNLPVQFISRYDSLKRSSFQHDIFEPSNIKGECTRSYAHNPLGIHCEHNAFPGLIISNNK